MKNKNKGFVGIALIIVLAIALGAGGAYYVTTKKNVDLQINSTPSTQTQDKKAPEAQEETSTSIKAPSASVSTDVKVSAPVAVTANTKISWSFPVVKALPDAGAMIQSVLTIDGKAYNIGSESHWCGVELKKVDLLPGQLSAARCSNGDMATEFAVRKDSTGYIITQADWQYNPKEIGKTPDSETGWRLRTKTILNIK